MARKTSTKTVAADVLTSGVATPVATKAPKAKQVKGAAKTTKVVDANPKPETKTEEKAPKAVVVRDAFGNRLNTRAHAINAVLLSAKAPLKASEIENLVLASELGKAYARETGKQVGGIRNHLQALLALKLVVNEAGKWAAVEDATKAQRLLEIAAEKEAAEKAASK